MTDQQSEHPLFKDRIDDTELCECCGSPIPLSPPIMEGNQHAFRVIIQSDGTVKKVEWIRQEVLFNADSWQPVCLVEVDPHPDDFGVIFELLANNSMQAVELALLGYEHLLETGQWTTDWFAWRDKIESGEYNYPTKFREHGAIR